MEEEAERLAPAATSSREGYVRITCPPDDGTWRSECTPAELEALDDLRKHPAARGYSDKYLMVFLMARKLDIARTIFLLELNREWRVKYGYLEPVKFSQLNMDLVRRMWAFIRPGARDKAGHGIFYLLPGNVEPRRYTAEEHRAFFVWLWEFFFTQETMEFFRNGMVIIEDMSRAGFRNFDYQSVKELIAIYQNHFPGRIKQVLLVNPSGTVRFVLRIVKLFVKGKVMQRITTLYGLERVKMFVDASQLVDRLGGSLAYDHVQWMEQMMRQSAIQSATPNRKQARHLTSPAGLGFAPVNPQQQQRQTPPSASASSLASISATATGDSKGKAKETTATPTAVVELPETAAAATQAAPAETQLL